MKRVYIIFSIIVVLGTLLYFYSYDITAIIKNRLKDEVTLRSKGLIPDGLTLIIRSDFDTLFSETVKNGTFEFPRLYGKNLFYLKTATRSKELDVSYWKDHEWSKAKLEISILSSGDSLRILWKRNYRDEEKNGEQFF